MEDSLICWALDGADIETAALGTVAAWAFDLPDLDRREIFSGIPATKNTSYDVWSETYDVWLQAPEVWKEIGWTELTLPPDYGLAYIQNGSHFAVETDENRNVFVKLELPH